MSRKILHGGRLIDASIAAAALVLSDAFNFSGTLQKSGVDIATLDDIEAAVEGLDPKPSVATATNGALAAYTGSGNKLTFDANGLVNMIDGASVTSDGAAGADAGTEAGSSKILVKDESGANEKWNGIYFLSDPGDASNPAVLTRIASMNADADVSIGARTFVEGGSTSGGKAFVVTAFGGTLNTDAVTWSLYASATVYTASNGITKSGNDFRIDPSDTNPALEVADGGVRVKVDGSGITRTSSGLSLGDGGTLTEKLSSQVQDRIGAIADGVKTLTGDGTTTTWDLATDDVATGQASNLGFAGAVFVAYGNGATQYEISKGTGTAGVDQVVFGTAPANGEAVVLFYRRTIVADA